MVECFKKQRTILKIVAMCLFPSVVVRFYFEVKFILLQVEETFFGLFTVILFFVEIAFLNFIFWWINVLWYYNSDCTNDGTENG